MPPSPASAPTAVVALGGNALTREDQTGTYPEQKANALTTARAIAGLLSTGYRVVVTHGNGPQVGNLSIQQEEGASLVPAQPLYALGAMTQGQIGHVLGLALAGVLGPMRQVVSVVTHVLVEPDDPAFRNPTKPIGPFFSRLAAERLAGARGWQVVEDAGRGFRRVVASPQPKEIVEASAIRSLVEAGFVVIAAGGGGIPVVRRRRHLAGIDAVVDKDLSAERLASAVGAELLLLLTGVDRVYLDFGTRRERPVALMTADEAEGHLRDGQFPPGSMGPKITAAIRFLHAGGEAAIVTSPRRAAEAVGGSQGTRIVLRRESAGAAAGL